MTATRFHAGAILLALSLLTAQPAKPDLSDYEGVYEYLVVVLTGGNYNAQSPSTAIMIEDVLPAVLAAEAPRGDAPRPRARAGQTRKTTAWRS